MELPCTQYKGAIINLYCLEGFVNHLLHCSQVAEKVWLSQIKWLKPQKYINITSRKNVILNTHWEQKLQPQETIE